MTLLSRFKDTTTATSTTVIHWTEVRMYFISGTASTKFKIQVRIIVESSNHCPKAHATDNKRSIVLLDAVLLKYEDTVSV